MDSSVFETTDERFDEFLVDPRKSAQTVDPKDTQPQLTSEIPKTKTEARKPKVQTLLTAVSKMY